MKILKFRDLKINDKFIAVENGGPYPVLIKTREAYIGSSPTIGNAYEVRSGGYRYIEPDAEVVKIY